MLSIGTNGAYSRVVVTVHFRPDGLFGPPGLAFLSGRPAGWERLFLSNPPPLESHPQKSRNVMKSSYRALQEVMG